MDKTYHYCTVKMTEETLIISRSSCIFKLVKSKTDINTFLLFTS